MPRIKGFTKEQKINYQKERVAETCELLLMRHKIKKTAVAEYLGITPQAVSCQFRNRKLTLETVMCVITLTNADPDKIKETLTIQ